LADVETSQCPFRRLHFNLPTTVFLDLGETVQGNMSFDYVHINNADVAPPISVTSSDMAGAHLGLHVHNMVDGTNRHTTLIRVTATNQTRDATGYGFVAVTARVATRSLQCANTAAPTIQVNVGCPPGRHVRVVAGEYGTNRCDDVGTVDERWIDHDSPFAEANYLRQRVDCQKVVRKYHGGAPWRPRLMLYDFDQMVEEVTADYVVFELQGRIDYTYNATESQVRCVQHAQSTQTLFNGEPYHPCWSGGSSTSDGRQPYELLNSTGSNAIQFTYPGGDGLFIFGARVVGANYSHCNLETSFAVLVFGAPINRIMSFLITMTTLGTLCVSLLASFLCFRRKVSPEYL